MLCRLKCFEIKVVALFHIRQYSIVSLATCWHLHSGKTVEANDAALRIQAVLSRANRYHCCGVFCCRHLSCDKLSPDHLVESLCITLHTFQHSLLYIDVRGPDRLVRLLGALFRGIGLRGLWQIARREIFTDVIATGGNRLATEVG